MFEMDKIIVDAGILSVVQIENVDDAVPLAQALVSGGIRTAEITFRNPEKIKEIANVISCIKQNVPELIVGGASVTSPDIAKIAVDSGAEFIISAGFKASTVEYCVKNNIPVYPGIATPSEIEVALDYNLSILKFFLVELFDELTQFHEQDLIFLPIFFEQSNLLVQSNYHLLKQHFCKQNIFPYCFD